MFEQSTGEFPGKFWFPGADKLSGTLSVSEGNISGGISTIVLKLSGSLDIGSRWRSIDSMLLRLTKIEGTLTGRSVTLTEFGFPWQIKKLPPEPSGETKIVISGRANIDTKKIE